MKYIERPIAIQAEEYKLGLEDGFMSMNDSLMKGRSYDNYNLPICAGFNGVPYITTLEGYHFISEGDYIITGIEGERYPCKRRIFEKTYISSMKINIIGTVLAIVILIFSTIISKMILNILGG